MEPNTQDRVFIAGEAWDYFSHDQARSRADRWGEDVKELYSYLDATPGHSHLKK